MRRHGVKRVVKFLVFAAIAVPLFGALLGLGVMTLWNWLGPGVFGWREITLWQALGLLVLCRILFGRMGSGGAMRSRWRMTGRWERTSPEERERLREGMRRWWDPVR